MLAAVDVRLPPIVVNRRRMRVIDGAHRLQAAIMRGDDMIEVRFFEGSDAEAFRLGVEANVKHGLPLSSAEREAAVVRIIASHPDWSDRAIGASTGLAGSTVSAIRRRSAVVLPEPPVRVGRDGRARPVNSAEGRRRASRVILERPGASLREVAAAAGISTGTVRDVRERLRRGEDPVPSQQREAERRQAHRPIHPHRAIGHHGGAFERTARTGNIVSTLDMLRRDPALRFSETGRTLIRWLHERAVAPDDWSSQLEAIPPHCLTVVADLMRQYAAAWHELADTLERNHATA
nr:ParB/RepB/Spo0J family partition protein [Kibdelosporangium sp. MJ126-NF4]